jgi:hypothetical protein
MKSIIELVVVTCSLWATLCFIDFFIFIAKSGAKVSYLTKRQWKIGFVCAIIATFYLANNHHLLNP